MKVGDLVRYKDWYGGFIGKVIATDRDEPYSWKIEWLVGNGAEVYSPTFEWASDLEVINESR